MFSTSIRIEMWIHLGGTVEVEKCFMYDNRILVT